MTELASIRAEVDAALRTWRESATLVALLVMAIVGLPVTIYFVTEHSFAYPWPARWVGMLTYCAVVGGAFLPRRHYQWRAVLLLASLSAIAAQQLLLTGLVGEGRILVLTIPVLATILMGARAGWISAAVSTLILGTFTVLASKGVLQQWQVIRENSVEFSQWFLQGTVLVGSLAALMVLLSRFLRLQLRTMLAERQARRAQDQFSRQLIAAQEKERRRIAGELHDGLGQDLLVITNQAQLGLAKTNDVSGTTARLTEIAEAASQALQQARRMAHNLRPGLLEELGLTEAVEASAQKAGQASGISMKLDLAHVDGLLPPEFEVNLFRILQEALTNILKHSSATEAKVTLAHEGSLLRLAVEDNGRGFDPHRRTDTLQPSMGLRQISERAEMMAGRVQLQSGPGQGTRLVVEVPVNES